MTQTLAIDRPPVAKEATVSRPGSTKHATVSASALAQHLDCSRTYIQKLEAEGVLHRDGGGFDLDASRIAYLRYLRRERHQSPRSEADAAFTSAKTRLMQLRIAEKEKVLMETEECFWFLERLVGMFRTGLGSLPAQVGGHDLQMRRRVERYCFDILDGISKEALMMAEKYEHEIEGYDEAG